MEADTRGNVCFEQMQAVKNKRNAYENARNAPALGAHDGGRCMMAHAEATRRAK